MHEQEIAVSGINPELQLQPPLSPAGPAFIFYRLP